jgi:hypothetical protein
MRQRQSLKVDRKSGAATVTTETLDDDVSFSQRIAELKASVPDIGPVEARFLALACNGCGTTAAVDFESPRLPDGWTATEAGDFCPGCQALNLSARISAIPISPSPLLPGADLNPLHLLAAS